MKKITVSKTFLREIIGFVSGMYIASNDVTPEQEDYHLFDGYIESLKTKIQRKNDEPFAQLMFEYALTSPDINFWDFDSGYAYEDGEFKAILLYVYNKLYPNSELPHTPPPIEFIDMDQYEWREKRDNLNPDN